MFDKVKRAMHRHSDGSWEEMQRVDERSSDVVDDPERQWLRDGAVYKCPCGDSFFIEHDSRSSNDLLAVPHA